MIEHDSVFCNPQYPVFVVPKFELRNDGRVLWDGTRYVIDHIPQLCFGSTGPKSSWLTPDVSCSFFNQSL